MANGWGMALVEVTKYLEGLKLGTIEVGASVGVTVGVGALVGVGIGSAGWESSRL